MVGNKMRADGVYDEFVSIALREYSLVFGSGRLDGEGGPLCLPAAREPDTGLVDYTACH